MDDDSLAVAGDRGGYVPCGDVAGSEPPGDDTDAIAGDAGGYVPTVESAGSEVAESDTAAVVGQGRGYVATLCCPCGTLPGSSGLVDPGGAITGTHTVIQSTAPTLRDSFTRVIPWVYPLPGEWYQWDVADTGQQWWHIPNPGAQAPPPPNTIELDGDNVVVSAWHAGGLQSAGRINWPSSGGYLFEDYDFGWTLADHGFDARVDVLFEQFSSSIIDLIQFTLAVGMAASDQANFSAAGVSYRVRRSTDPTQLFLARGGSPTPATITLPPLVPNTWYRIRWQVDGPLCNSRAKIWPRDDPEPAAWDGETTLLAPMPPNATFGATANVTGTPAGALPWVARMDNLALDPLNLNNCWATVCEDDVVQIGPRQYQLRNSYLPSTITAFVEHAGYPLVMYSRLQATPNIVEDDPVAGIFSFPASISYSPAYNPTIGLGTVVSACYIVPPA